jgi:hypothetical protein
MEFTTANIATPPITMHATTNQGESKQSGDSDIAKAMSKLKVDKKIAAVNETPRPTIHPLLLNFATRGGFATSDDALLLLEKNCICSSLGVPFLVVSKAEFVHGHNPLMDAAEYDKFLSLLLAGVKAQRGKNILADFEGEMPGFGGELICAQFLPTKAIENGTLSDRCGSGVPSTLYSPDTAGLLVDLRDLGGLMITQLIMNDQAYTKLIWGATGDLTSLRYQSNLGQIHSKNVVDVQLGFSSPGRLLGMGKAVSGLPNNFKRNLPDKDQGHDWSPRAENRRCVPLPLSTSFAKYAMDDLHRIDAILSFKRPRGRSYKTALLATNRFLAELENAQGAITQVQRELGYFGRKYGMQKRIKAVEINRVLIHIQNAFKGQLSTSQKQVIKRALQRVCREVLVTIPKDLSWY